MSVLRAFPYRTADAALRAELVAVDESVSARSDGTWEAYSTGVEAARMQIRWSVDMSALEGVLPEGEAVAEQAEGLVVVRSKLSRRREVVARVDLQAPKPVELHLAVDDHTGEVGVEFQIVRSRRRREAPGFADLLGAVLAQQHAGSLWFDEPKAPTGRSIDITWTDFNESPTLPDQNLFALRLADRPMIYLNSGIPLAYEILNSKGTHGAAARIRDAVFSQVVHQVWTSLLGHCFMSVLRVAHEDPSSTLDRLATWESEVLQEWAPHFKISEPDTDSAVRALISDLLTTGSTLLIEAVGDVVQSRMETVKGFNGLVRESDRFNAEVTS